MRNKTMRRLGAMALTWLMAAASGAAGAAPPSDPTLEITLPGIQQVGEVANCGPTAAAMVVAAYRGVSDVADQRALRDAIGRWSWGSFPLRRVRIPGYDAGMTTLGMLRAALERFAPGAGFAPVAHRWIPHETWALTTLRRAVSERRPVLALVQSSILWDVASAELHWVVIRGFQGDQVIYNDPADGTRSEVSLVRFLQAWRLNELYRSLPMVDAYQGLVADAPLPRTTVTQDAPRARPALAR